MKPSQVAMYLSDQEAKDIKRAVGALLLSIQEQDSPNPGELARIEDLYNKTEDIASVFEE